MVAQLCEYTKKKTKAIHFKWVNCVVNESQLNKAILKTNILLKHTLKSIIIKLTGYLKGLHFCTALEKIEVKVSITTFLFSLQSYVLTKVGNNCLMTFTPNFSLKQK